MYYISCTCSFFRNKHFSCTISLRVAYMLNQKTAVLSGERKNVWFRWPDPTYFFRPTLNFFSIWIRNNMGRLFYSILKKISNYVLKRSCLHYKNKTTLNNFNFSFKTMICCLDCRKVNFEKRNVPSHEKTCTSCTSDCAEHVLNISCSFFCIVVKISAFE